MPGAEGAAPEAAPGSPGELPGDELGVNVVNLLKVPGVLSSSRSLIEQSIRLLSPNFHDKQGRYGTMSVAQWQAYADWMTRTHLMSTHVDARTALTLR